jgi:hypothetical protein
MSLILRRVNVFCSIECGFEIGGNVHASGTARHLPALLQAVDLPAAVRLVLALHEVIIEGLAAVSDEVSRAQERRRCGTDFFHLRDVVGHGGGVHQDSLAEAVRRGMYVSFPRSI